MSNKGEFEAIGTFIGVLCAILFITWLFNLTPKEGIFFSLIAWVLLAFIVLMNVGLLASLDSSEKGVEYLLGTVAASLVVYGLYLIFGLPSTWWIYLIAIILYLMSIGLFAALFNIPIVKKLAMSIFAIALIYYSPYFYGLLGIKDGVIKLIN